MKEMLYYGERREQRLMKVISVDLGATSGRVMTVTHSDHRFSYVENARFMNRVYKDGEGILRWDFPYLFRNVTEGIGKALKENPDAASIVIDTWGVDYGLLKDGKLLKDPACYRDKRTFASQEELLKRVPFSRIYSLTGIQNLHFNTIYQLNSEHLDYSNVDAFLMIPDLIAYFLTGEARLEECNASTTSLYDKKNKRMSKELLGEIGVPERIFPKLIFPGETYGNLKKEFLPEGFSKDVPVVAVPTHDTASAVLGADGQGEFAYVSSGTWSLIGTELKSPIISEESRKANFTNEIGYGSTVRFLKNTMGMFLINEARNDYKKHGQEVRVSDIVPPVESAKDVSCYLDVDNPLFETPGDMLMKIRTYADRTHQERPETPGETMKVIYRSMACRYKKILSDLENLAKVRFSSILVVGGGNRAEILNQYIADVCRINAVTGPSEATVLGNALAQFIALKEIPDVSKGRKDIAASLEERIYRPQDTEKAEEEYQKFLIATAR